MKKNIFLAILFFLLVVTPCLSGQVSLSTYYPSPSGAYSKLILVPQDKKNTKECAVGTLYVDKEGFLNFCEENGEEKGEWGSIKSYDYSKSETGFCIGESCIKSWEKSSGTSVMSLESLCIPDGKGDCTAQEPKECPADWIEADYNMKSVGSNNVIARTCYSEQACRVMYLEGLCVPDAHGECTEDGPAQCPSGWKTADYKIARWYNLVRTCYKCTSNLPLEE
ncbi:MAG: hypothetical protein P9X22_05860 [Candidatus Zapsychrus exili]|nr:hypothetical protein [Candidatus Zapsychrus exili]